MPFAGHQRRIIRQLQLLGHRDAVAAQFTAITGSAPVFHHLADASFLRIQPGEQRRPCQTTARRRIKFAELNALRRQPVQVRRRNFGTETAKVRIPMSSAKIKTMFGRKVFVSAATAGRIIMPAPEIMRIIRASFRRSCSGRSIFINANPA